MDEEDGFLQAIAEAPDDVRVRLVYADWLEERGDTRCEYLRTICALEPMPESLGDEAIHRNSELRTLMQKLSEQVTHEWELAVCRPGALVLEDYPRESKLPVVRTVKVATGMMLVPTVRLVHALPTSLPSRPLPRVILQAVTAEFLESVRSELEATAGVKVRAIVGSP